MEVSYLGMLRNNKNMKINLCYQICLSSFFYRFHQAWSVKNVTCRFLFSLPAQEKARCWETKEVKKNWMDEEDVSFYVNFWILQWICVFMTLCQSHTFFFFGLFMTAYVLFSLHIVSGNMFKYNEKHSSCIISFFSL